MSIIPPDRVATEREKFYASVPEDQRPSAEGAYRDPFMKDQNGDYYFNEWTAGAYNRAPGATHAEDPDNFKVVPTFYNDLSKDYYDQITADLKDLQGKGFKNIRRMINKAYGKLD